MRKSKKAETALFNFPSTIGLMEIEDLILKNESSLVDVNVDARAPIRFKKGLLVDIWVAIALGTIFRTHHKNRSRIWGISEKKQLNIRQYATSLPGLTSLCLSEKVTTDRQGQHEENAVYGIPNRESKIASRYILEWLKDNCGGYPKGKHIDGDSRFLIEFDGEVAKKIADYSKKRGLNVDRVAMREIILEMRRDLEFWSFQDKSSRLYSMHDDPLSDLTSFIKELFENSRKYGKTSARIDSNLDNQLNFLRVKKYIDIKSQKALAKRAASTSSTLERHITSSIENSKDRAIIEVNVSDFGLGILDYYLSTKPIEGSWMKK